MPDDDDYKVMAGIQPVAGTFDFERLVGQVMRTIAVQKCRQPCSGTHCRSRWAIVRDHLGIGSTSARALCRHFGYDPEQIVRERR